MKNINLNPLSKTILQDGYLIRLFTTGDEYNWTKIIYKADEFIGIDEAMDYFDEHF